MGNYMNSFDSADGAEILESKLTMITEMQGVRM